MTAAGPSHAALVLAAGLGLSLDAQAAQRTSLETLLDGARGGAAFESAWTPDGRALVYRRTERGGASVYWREDVASGRRTRLVDWAALLGDLRRQRPAYAEPPMDDPEDADGRRFALAWSADARRVAGLESGDLYLLDLDTGRARFVTGDPAPELFPAFDPAGARLAYVRGGDLWALDLRDGTERRLTTRPSSAVLNGMADWAYEEEFGVARSFWWSPDGRRLLFVQYDQSDVPVHALVDDLDLPARVELQRYPQAGAPTARVRLGLVEADGSAPPLWLDLGSATDFYLPRAGFAPDGGVWYQWLSRDQKRLELRLVGAGGGAPRTLLVEQDAAWVNVRDDLRFVDARRFVWSSERDGWRHLFLYALDGRLLARLTSGEWQVEKVHGFDAERRRVFFEATEKDVLERHVYAVGLDGAGFQRLSREDGTHEARFAPDGRHWLDTHSRAEQPPRIDLRTADGGVLRVFDDGAREDALEPPGIEFGRLAADDGSELRTALLKPRSFDPSRRYPALLYVYGGPHAQTVRDRWDERLHSFLRHLADQGMVVFWLDNRGTWARGHAFEARIAGRLGDVESADQLAGVRHLTSLPYVDGSRLGVYGGSYGGFLALTLLLRAPDLFAAGAVYAPVTDWRFYDAPYTERYLGTPQSNPEGYAKSAPLVSAPALRARLLLFHGTFDNNVHPQNTLQFADALRRAGRPFEQVLYPRVRHGIRRSRAALDFHRRVAAFLARELGASGVQGVGVDGARAGR